MRYIHSRETRLVVFWQVFQSGNRGSSNKCAILAVFNTEQQGKIPVRLLPDRTFRIIAGYKPKKIWIRKIIPHD